MSPSVFILSLAFLLSSPASQTVRHFKKVLTSQFPRAIVLRDFCGDDAQCSQDFQKEARVWSGDVNGDGINELLVAPGGNWAGDAGSWHFLYQKRGKDWVSLTEDPRNADNSDDDGWLTQHPRFEILPLRHGGYYDLRVAVDLCMKWDGKKYIEYDPLDYRSLYLGWFNPEDSHEAEIFWAIHYSGQDRLTFAPQWFPITNDDFLTSESPHSGPVADPRVVSTTLDDPQENLRWYGLVRGGIWAVRGDRAFFLAPQLSETYESVRQLELEGDWLLGFGRLPLVDQVSPSKPRPSIRYNRRTHELILDRHDHDDLSPDK